MATSSISPVSQLPNIPQKLPTTQSEWQQIVNILQNWAQILQGSVTKFQLTTTGLSPNLTVTAVARVTDNVVTLKVPFIQSTSGGTTFTLVGLPNALQPASLSTTQPVIAEDNGANVLAQASIVAGSGTITLSMLTNPWTGTGQKGLAPSTLLYLLD